MVKKIKKKDIVKEKNMKEKDLFSLVVVNDKGYYPRHQGLG